MGFVNLLFISCLYDGVLRLLFIIVIEEYRLRFFLFVFLGVFSVSVPYSFICFGLVGGALVYIHPIPKNPCRIQSFILIFNMFHGRISFLNSYWLYYFRMAVIVL